MSKEMIISVNGREKKIAILDNGKVTEYYIERGEENSGVVGNIYKGRVMRVLPGMQSAFVEIGLERDAFLYVSDFFDEEEEIERIVMEKSKKGSPEDARKEADERIARARVEREKQMEAVQEIAEPMAESENEIASDEIENSIEEPQTEEAQTDEAATEEFQPQDRKRNRRRGKKGRPEGTENSSDETQNTSEEVFEQAVPEEYNPIFIEHDSSFERIIDDEETGEMFKDAYMQEAIVDKVRAIEFDMETTGAAEVGSLLGSVNDSSSGFERIADDDDDTVQETQVSQNKRRSRGGKGRNKSSQKPEVEVTAQAEQVESRNETESKGKSPKKSAKGKKVDESAIESETIKNEQQKAATASKSKSSQGKKSSRKPKKSNDGETLEDAEASVKDSSGTAEMAVRRGGRGGRNRRAGRTGQPSEATDGYENSEVGEGGAEENEAVNVEVKPVEREPVAVAPEREPQPNRNKNYQGNAPRRDPRDSRDSRDNRDNNRDSRDNRDNRDSRDNRRSQPTITDLLREGQEILVQIAKEPIARKGARITSHIALPGRFLVYMPTIEHLGVSRKIESASERSRLRVLIQKIRVSEDIPSGGFIVRTAGTGITEEDLRQDARYLVRTWLDVKKASEKRKSPALVHQDLDIIQRILRDQLSDEFTAIRVDSEEEYLRIVEFINRIQPRMVNRVKLYTRDEPILESYNVQEEIDKALKPRVWLKSGGYLVINQTEALVAIDVNTGKFVGKGNARLEDTITKTNMEAVDEIARQIRLRDLGGIIVLDLIDMEDRRNRNKVAQALQEALASDKSPTKVLSFNDFGLIIMTRKRVKQSLERTMCAPCEYCEGAGWVKSPQTVCYEILEESRRLSKALDDVRQTTLRVHPEVAEALRKSEREVLEEIEAYLGNVDITADKHIHQAQFDFAFV
jgi:ribonuclease G